MDILFVVFMAKKKQAAVAFYNVKITTSRDVTIETRNNWHRDHYNVVHPRDQSLLASFNVPTWLTAIIAPRMRVHICIYMYTYAYITIYSRVHYPFVIAGCKPCRELCGKQETSHAAEYSLRISSYLSSLATYFFSSRIISTTRIKTLGTIGMKLTPFSLTRRDKFQSNLTWNLDEKSSIGLL